jgi:hypothetical protein
MSLGLLWFEVVHFSVGALAALLTPEVVLKSYLPDATVTASNLELTRLLVGFYLAIALFSAADINTPQKLSPFRDKHLILSVFYACCFALDLLYLASFARRPFIGAFHLAMSALHLLSAISLSKPKHP